MARRDPRTRRARAAAEERKRRAAAVQRDEAGRVHLALHRDPANGRERVALLGALFKEAWQDEFAAGAANTARAVLGSAPSRATVVELAQSAMAATSRFAEALLAQAPQGSVACKAGCDHCCYQVVGVTPPEALAIFEHLRATLTPEALAALTAEVARTRAAHAGLSADERFSPAYPCVFLRDGQCSIYAVRPLACRGMNSLDAGECEARLRDPDARRTFLAAGRGGHAYLEPIRAFQAISAGLQLALSELYGLDARPLDLPHAMHLLLASDGAAADAWLAGESPLAPALLEENADALAELSGRLEPAKSRPR